MKFKNTTMYHFHKKGIKDELWMVGEEFFIDKDFDNNLCEGIELIDNSLPLIEQKIEYYKLIKNDYGVNYIREVMLELFRSLNYPDLVSRINCMYFCDEKSLLYWSNIFRNNYDLFEVSLTGNIFKSCAKFIPEMKKAYTYEEFERLADIYWNPNFSDSNTKYFSEYLFQGKVKVRKKLDPDYVKDKYRK